MNPLEGLRVLEYDSPLTAHAGRLLWEMGADVVLVEPPGGSALRSDAAAFAHHHAGKRAVTSDTALLATADVVLEGTLLGDVRAPSVPPGAIHVVVSPLGTTGPRSDWLASDLVVSALGGLVSVIGWPDRPPRAAPADQAWHLASLNAAIGVLLALASGQSQRVEISALECVAASLEAGAISYIHADARVGRSGIEHPLAPHRLFRARDGWVAGGLGGNPRMWDGLLEWMAESGEDADLRTDAMRDPATLPVNRTHVFDVIERFTAQRTRDEVFHEGQRRRLPWASVLTPAEVASSPQLEARGALVEVEYDGRVATDVAPPLRRRDVRRVAPDPATTADWLGSYAPPARAATRGALDGVVVLDLTWVLAGPYATRILADHGARVIKIESEHRPDPTRFSRFTHLSRGEFDPNTSGYFNNVNRNKQSVQLNLRDPAGIDVFLDLVERADVVIENFSAGLLDRMGIGAPVLHERNPGLVVVSMSGLGATGPWRSYVSYADAISALCGFTSLCDDDDRLSPVVHGLADIVAGHHAALATIAALLAGGGTWVDLSQLEAMAAQIGPALLEPPAPRPHDRVYPCLGLDRWVAAEAVLDEAWTRARPAEAVAEALQARGIAAGAVQDGRDLVEHDPQLRARGFYPVVEHPRVGAFVHEGVPIELSVTPGAVWTAAPLLGADTDEVLASLAGYSIADIAKLRDAGVLA